MVRGIRGAIVVEANEREAIHAATDRLLREVLARNELESEDIVSILLTTTPDLNADFPAYSVRAMGLTHVPVLGAREMEVPGAMGMMLRMLMHVNTDRSQKEIRHVYLGEAAKLRPDLAGDEA